jgi:hypothetical protein
MQLPISGKFFQPLEEASCIHLVQNGPDSSIQIGDSARQSAGLSQGSPGGITGNNALDDGELLGVRDLPPLSKRAKGRIFKPADVEKLPPVMREHLQ